MRRRVRRRLEINCRLQDEALEAIADGAEYVGSAEHKTYPSPAGQPALRSDATPCDPIDYDDINAALAEGIRRGCVSEVMEQGFPKYVWGWLDGELYEARHLNGVGGQYKGYRLESAEYPRDPDGRLNRGRP